MSEYQMDVRNSYDAQRRLLDLIAQSCQSAVMDKESLAKKYETSVRTIERDLEKLLEFGFLISRLDLNKFRLVSGPDNPMISAAVKQFAEKSDMSDLYPSLETRFLRELIEGRYDEVLNVNTGRFKQSAYEIQLFPKLIRSVSQHLEVSFVYKGKSRDHVHPYRLLNRGGVWYLLAYEGKLKTFVISKISTFTVHEGDSFEPTQEIKTSVEQVSCAESSVWFGKDEILFRLKIDSEAASYFKRRKVFPSQRLAGAFSDGSIELEVKVHHEQAVLPHVMSWLPHIQIIEPVHYQQSMEKMLLGYVRQTVDV